jgi:hypothetical protein
LVACTRLTKVPGVARELRLCAAGIWGGHVKCRWTAVRYSSGRTAGTAPPPGALGPTRRSTSGARGRKRRAPQARRAIIRRHSRALAPPRRGLRLIPSSPRRARTRCSRPARRW